jgi:diaminohydroxyphosphoribosylaminopyrimidine deaminase/5-amino-6-(5-phosphoribosylamino)uracil reductase
MTTGMPQVALKLALSLDGRIATRTGESKWVTGPEARVKVQQLRAQSDAVAVGIGTALADDPRLTVRDEALLVGGRAPTRVVFDTKLRLPTNARVVETAHEVPTWILAGADAPQDAEQALADAGCHVMRIPMTAEGRVDVSAGARIAGGGGHTPRPHRGRRRACGQRAREPFGGRASRLSRSHTPRPAWSPRRRRLGWTGHTR